MAQVLDIAGGDPGRQDVLAAKAVITFGSDGDTAVAGTFKAIAVPAGATVVGGYVNVTDATTGSIDIGDDDSITRYGAGINIGATGFTALTPTGYKYTADDTIDITITGDPADDGEAELVIQYIIDGRAAFVQK